MRNLFDGKHSRSGSSCHVELTGNALRISRELVGLILQYTLERHSVGFTFPIGRLYLTGFSYRIPK